MSFNYCQYVPCNYLKTITEVFYYDKTNKKIIYRIRVNQNEHKRQHIL
ncbi:hypothetical protein THOG11_140064 [Vibrio harveyi]|nr:hypothetical protein TH15OA1_480125 [Vibrio harveyi]CAH1555154.1 hypothetical protein THOG11_140064 [Vibrio harveyi]